MMHDKKTCCCVDCCIARQRKPKKVTVKKPSKSIIGKHAWLRNIHCRPKEAGGCTIIALSSRGPEYVIVEWSADGIYHGVGDVDVVKLSSLDVR